MSKKNASLEALRSPILLQAMIYIGLIVIGLSSVSAEVESLGIFKQNQAVTLVQTCDNCTYVNITKVQLPNSTIIRIGELMTPNGEEYSYSFSNTDALGQYIATTCGDADGSVTCVSYDFEVTTTGSDRVNMLPLYLLLGASIILGLAFLMDKNEYIGLLSGLLYIIAAVYLIIYGLGVFADNYTRALGYVTLGIGLIISFASVYEMFRGEEGD